MSDEAIREAIEHVRANIGAGYGWGAWTSDEYAMAERVIRMIEVHLASSRSITEELPEPQKTLQKCAFFD